MKPWFGYHIPNFTFRETAPDKTFASKERLGSIMRSCCHSAASAASDPIWSWSAGQNGVLHLSLLISSAGVRPHPSRPP